MFTRGTANADVLNGGTGDDTLYGNGGNDKLSGNAGNDILTGDAGDDSLNGGAGEDYLMGGAGNDTLDGGADADWASYEDATAAVKVDLNLTTAQNTLGGGTDTLKNIENLYGSAFNDTLLGNAASNYLHGGAGNDSLFGANGDDHFEGGAGDDTLNGGNGDDVVSYEDGLAGGVTIDLNLTTGQANGAHGTDTLISIEAVWGSTFDDKLTGNAADNYLYGGNGADLLKGGAGADVLLGADGNDTIVGGQGADDLTGGAGNDLFQFANGDSGVFNSLGGVAAGTTDVINDFQGGTRGTGTAAGTGDTLDFGLTVGTATNYVENTAATAAAAATQARAAFTANHGLLYVATQVGADVQLFAADADGGEAHNMVTLKSVSTAAIGFNNITGTAVVVPPDPHLITGTANAELLSGSSAAAETISGLAGNDTIVGDGSGDTLLGGDGDDTFKFDIRSGATTVDGGSGTDTIDFSGSTTPNHGVLFEFMPLPSSPPATFFGDPQPAIQFSSIENLRGTNFYDILGGDDAANAIWGAGGGDLINGMGGADTIDGGDGDDSLRGWDGDDSLIGGAGNDLINGLNGNDTITAGDGDDTLRGDDGADVLTGGAGNDLFDFETAGSTLSAPDQITDFQAGDHLDFRMVQGTAANYVENTAATLSAATNQANAAFAANSGLRYVATQVGSDVQLFASNGGAAQSLVTLKSVTTAAIDFSNIVGAAPPPPVGQTITGTPNADNLIGGEGNDTILGLDGDDTITGGRGADTLNGGADNAWPIIGSDLYKFAEGDSTLSAPDQISNWSTGTRGIGAIGGTGDMLDFGLERGSSTNYVEANASSGADALTQANIAFAANHGLRYFAANIAGSSDTQVFATDADGGEAHSLVTVKGANTILISYNSIVGQIPSTGELLQDTIYDDRIVGGSGNDTIIAGKASDTVTGGGGADLFVQRLGGSLTITDFNSAEDHIDLGRGPATAFNYAERMADPTDSVTSISNMFQANPLLRYLAVQNVGSVTVYTSDYQGSTLSGGVSLNGITLADLSFSNLVGENIGGPHREGSAGADVLVGLPATPLNQPGFEHEQRDEYFSGGPGDDTIKPGSGDDTISSGVGNDLIVYSPGDGIAGSGYTHAAIDIILDFEGGTRSAGVVGGTGDEFDFGLGAGSATNYVETTSTDYFHATSTALGLFSANAALRYVVAQVDDSSYLFANDRGDTKVTVALGGVTLDGISAQNIVDVIPRTPAPQLLVGSVQDDVIVGGTLNDILSGGAGGNDILFGGAGDDTFRFGPSDGAGFDHVYDFQGGTLSTGAVGGAGDKLQIGLGAGTVQNYLEIDAPYQEHTPVAQAAFAGNSNLRYVVVADAPSENGFARVDVFYSDADGGEIQGEFRLDGFYGFAGLSNIGYLNFV
jgi:Ca2+-binding RTX toxin-like protein